MKVFIFVKNKLNSTDTVIPLLLELNNKFSITSELVVFDQLAYEGINNNHIIYDVINNIGCINLLSKGINNKIIRRFFILTGLIRIFLNVVIGKAKIFHFGFFDRGILRISAKLFGDRIFRLQGNAYNTTFNKYDKILKRKVNSFMISNGNVILFDGKIKGMNLEKGKNIGVYNFGPSRTRSYWVDYIKSKDSFYFNKYHKGVDISRGVIVFMVGLIDKNGYSTSIEKGGKYDLFNQTIDVLSNKASIPVFIKPHVTTDVKIVNNKISKLDNFFITYLHPNILSLHARVMIANQFSNTLADAYSYGVPTIEFTNYKKNLLEATNGCSCEPKYVTHFINNDISKFDMILSKIIDSRYNSTNFNGYEKNNTKLFKEINK